MAEEQKEETKEYLLSEDEAYKEASQSTADYAEYEKPSKEPNPIWRKLGIFAASLITVAVLAGGAYWLLKGHKASKQPAQSSQTETTPVGAVKITTTTKHYDSSNFNLGFDHPSDWTVSDTGNGALTVKSPAIKLKDADGENTDAQISLLIRPNTDKLVEFDSGNAIAAINSEKIAYTQPSQTQRANTYLSFPRYAHSSAGMDGIYITGDFGYKSAQSIPKVDIQKIDPVISVVFGQCTNQQCSGNNTSLTISTDNWDNQSFSDPLKNMLQSFTIN